MKLGDTVTWASQAQGVEKTKTGVVVDVVSAKKMPDRERFLSLYKGAGCGSPRNHESYVIKVDVGKKPGKTFRHYWPRVSALMEVAK